jgi:hypothetical protein
MHDDNELREKRFELRQKLKCKLLNLSSSQSIVHSFQQFIPNSRDNDFLIIHGLDCVMNYLSTDSMSHDERMPYVCSICHCDSTENWWYSLTDNGQTLIYLCDPCEQNRMRRWIVHPHSYKQKKVNAV